MKCWISGHDWEVLDAMEEVSGDHAWLLYELKVCMKCEKVVDEITPYKARLEQRRRNRLSRKERAQIIYGERHKRC